MVKNNFEVDNFFENFDIQVCINLLSLQLMIDFEKNGLENYLSLAENSVICELRPKKREEDEMASLFLVIPMTSNTPWSSVKTIEIIFLLIDEK